MTPVPARSPRGLALALAIFVAASFGAGGVRAQSTAIERGEYLARAGDCVSCHTANGGAPFAGGLRLDTPFGYMLAPNITPDADTGIGRWSSDDFYRALHTGVNKHGQDMYPTMPYDFYTRVTRADVDALYAYLRTVKPVRNAVDREPPLLSVQPALVDGRVARALFHRGHVPAGSDEDRRRGIAARTSSKGLGHCSDCHSPRNLLGGIEKSKDVHRRRRSTAGSRST